MKAIQKTLQCIVVLLTILTVFHACKKEETDLSGSYSVTLAQITKIPSGGNEATIALAKVTDNRCPSNAVCTTAGSAVATFAIHDEAQDQLLTLTLSGSASDPSDVQQVSINSRKYFIKITEVSPYPGSSTQTTQTKAIILLSNNKI